MKRIWAVLGAVALCIGLFSGCAPEDSSAAQAGDGAANVLPQDETEERGDRLRVVATIFPQYDFVRQIAGEHVELTMLLNPGLESHSFEPTPQDIIRIEECDLFIHIGGENDRWVERILDAIDTSGVTVVALMDLVDAVPEEIVEGMEHDDEDHDHGEDDDHSHEEEAELDEHVWTNPKNAERIVAQLTELLCEMDGDNAGVYRENGRAYREQLQALDASFQEVVDGAVRDTVVFGDRFPFRYLADAYGLSYYAAFPGCSTETEASAATVAFLIDKVRDEEIPVVFFIEFSNERMADTLCESSGARKLLLHSCHNVTRDDFESGVGYLELMQRNVDNLKEALH